LTHVQDLVSGGEFFCALRAKGDVWCWGRSSHGALGDGRSHESKVPVRVKLATPVAQISPGEQHVCVVHETGDASCWGDNSRGTLGIGLLPPCCDIPDPQRPPEYLTPQLVRGLPPSGSVNAAGLSTPSTCALTRGGDVYCWGENEAGQLGSPATPEPLSFPKRVEGLPPARQLTIGIPSCILSVDGETYCWGDGCPLADFHSRPVRITWPGPQ